MLEIIRKGIEPSKRFIGYKVECRKCTCIYKVTEDEFSPQYTQDGLINYWNCPFCGSINQDGQGGCFDCTILETLYDES